MSTARSQERNRITSKATLAAGAGTTLTVDVPIPTDKAMFLRAEVIGGKLDGTSHLQYALRLVAEGVCKNFNGTVSFPSGISTSQNPKSASNLAGSDAQVSDIGAEATLSWSVNSTNARLTLASGGAGSVACDVQIIIDTCLMGSV